MKYCQKHNQSYMDHLSICPICIGEKMIDYSHKDADVIHKKALKELEHETNRDNRNEKA